MTGHDRFLELAASAIDFELTHDESTALQRHLAGCSACRPRTAEIRADARSTAALPLLQAGWSAPSALALTRSVRGRSSASLRLIAMAALTLAVVTGIAVVGAEIIRRQEMVVPTVTTGPSPTVPASPTSVPSSVPVAGQWHVESIEVGSLPFGIAAVAASGSRLVAVGGVTCTPGSPPYSGPTDCWATVFTSDDGGRSWIAAPRSDALATAVDGPVSGPESRMLDVAGGPGGFVAIGYDRLLRAAAWKSVDGRDWTVSPPDATWDRARVRAVAATSTGWVVGGEVFLDAGPRAAIWESPDGVTWTRAPDGPAFDVGGYLDTGEEPGSGGIADVTSHGSITVGVGSSCDDKGFNCEPAVWTSSGGPWSRSLGRSAFSGLLRAATTFGEDLIAGGLQCTPDPCLPDDRLAVAVRSMDGVRWTESGVPGTTGTFGIVALAATAGYVVGVVSSIEGAETVASELILVGSVDGDTWEILGGLPQVGLSPRAVGVTAIPDGSILIIGSGQAPSVDPGDESFVLRVTRTSS